ncbi:MAG: PfkB family carbohydrate kinase [Rectinemataceae bacterium]
MAELEIPPASVRGCDFLALGALVTRLDPGIVPFSAADRYDLHVSGGEYNVAADLALCFGMRTAVASAMVDYPIGLKVRGAVRASGVEGHYVEYKHDGVRGPNIAQVWSDRGQGLRPPVVFYNRANEAAALLGPGSFDWKAMFAPGLRWFHSGGIFAALSGTTPELIIEAMRSAHDAGAIVSFDLNYRAKLWSAAGDEGPGRARKTLGRIVEEVDVLLGNEEDLQMGLGLSGPAVGGRSKLDPAAFLATIEEVGRRYPRIKAVATTLREVKSTNRHGWSAVLWLNGKSHLAPACELDVYDRVGGGDGFAAGLIFGLLGGRDPDEALRLGWAHGALVTSFPGDTTMATLEQVEALARGGSARIQR